jgi:hypothetical protein
LLIPALLIGAWDETKEADRKLIASLALKSYEQAIAEMSHWLNTFDSPIEKVGNAWRLVSHDVAWHFLSRFLIEDDLSRFGEIVVTILGVSGPQLAANAHDKELPYSRMLMQGISETLALLSIRGLPVATQYSITVQHRLGEMGIFFLFIAYISGSCARCILRSVDRGVDWRISYVNEHFSKPYMEQKSTHRFTSSYRNIRLGIYLLLSIGFNFVKTI